MDSLSLTHSCLLLKLLARLLPEAWRGASPHSWKEHLDRWRLRSVAAARDITHVILMWGDCFSAEGMTWTLQLVLV
jgi:hypothetical protein